MAEGEQTVSVQRDQMTQGDLQNMIDEGANGVVEDVTSVLRDEVGEVNRNVSDSASGVTDSVLAGIEPMLDNKLGTLKAQSDEQATATQYVMLPDEQWAGVVDAGRLCCSCAVICSVMLAALCGLVAFRILTQGWSR